MTESTPLEHLTDADFEKIFDKIGVVSDDYNSGTPEERESYLMLGTEPTEVGVYCECGEIPFKCPPPAPRKNAFGCDLKTLFGAPFISRTTLLSSPYAAIHHAVIRFFFHVGPTVHDRNIYDAWMFYAKSKGVYDQLQQGIPAPMPRGFLAEAYQAIIELYESNVINRESVPGNNMMNWVARTHQYAGIMSGAINKIIEVIKIGGNPPILNVFLRKTHMPTVPDLSVVEENQNRQDLCPPVDKGAEGVEIDKINAMLSEASECEIPPCGEIAVESPASETARPCNTTERHDLKQVVSELSAAFDTALSKWLDLQRKETEQDTFYQLADLLKYQEFRNALPLFIAEWKSKFSMA